MSYPPPPPSPPLPILPPPFSDKQPTEPQPPAVPGDGPPGAFLVELLIYNGYPFMDHWAYFVRSHQSSSLGIRIHATGAVNVGFELEIQRMHNVDTYEDKPYKRVSLGWLDSVYFDKDATFNHFQPEMKIDAHPACPFEISLFKVAAPEKSLNTVGANITESAMKPVVQRNCQTWVVKSADQLVTDGLFDQEVAVYLYTIKQ